MHSLIPLTALGTTAPMCEIIGGTTITEVTDLALASVAARQGHEEACSAILTRMLGNQPPKTGKSTKSVPYSAFWIGSEQCMVTASCATHETLATIMKSELRATASVTEQNDGWVCFDLSGPKVIDLLERLCPVSVRRMAKEDAQRTTIDHLGCFVLCVEAAYKMRILGPRSSAGSLFHALKSAALSVA